MWAWLSGVFKGIFDVWRDRGASKAKRAENAHEVFFKRDLEALDRVWSTVRRLAMAIHHLASRVTLPEWGASWDEIKRDQEREYKEAYNAARPCVEDLRTDLPESIHRAADEIVTLGQREDVLDRARADLGSMESPGLTALSKSVLEKLEALKKLIDIRKRELRTI